MGTWGRGAVRLWGRVAEEPWGRGAMRLGNSRSEGALRARTHSGACLPLRRETWWWGLGRVLFSNSFAEVEPTHGCTWRSAPVMG